MESNEPQKSGHDPLEMLGAVLSGLGLMAMAITGGRALGFSLITLAFGFVIWKMGEMRGEFNERLESMRSEMEYFKRT